MMQDKQDLIIQHNFTYRLPKSILDKLTIPLDNHHDLDNKHKNKEGGKNEGKNDGKPGPKHQIKSLKDIVTDPDPSHMRWRVKENENFTKTFFFNSKKCPKTSDGKIICMKLFLRGICDKQRNRAHKLPPEDEQAFDTFVTRCREGGASKPDF
jgi:hypothetical protein